MDELLIDGIFPASRGYSGYRGDDGVARDECRVAGQNSDARTAIYGDDAAFLSNFGANAAHFSLPISRINMITSAWATRSHVHEQKVRACREFYAALMTYDARFITQKRQQPA
jgi:hypothetical protein